jgi:hypothetical protein
MKSRGWLCGVGMAVILTASGGALVACGTPEAKFATTKAGPMPAGETWTGVYYNPVYGYLNLVENGGSLVAKWRRTDSSHWGEMSGTVDGDIAHFTWKERRFGSLDPSGESHGTGVFVYKLPAGDHPIAELDGQYALEASSDVGVWHCVKQEGMKPDLNAVTGDNPAIDPGSHDKWE